MNLATMAWPYKESRKDKLHQKPELILDETRAWFAPEQIDLAADSFDINVVISNVGKAFRDSFRVEIQQFFQIK